MSKDQSDDDQGQRFLWENQGEPSLPRHGNTASGAGASPASGQHTPASGSSGSSPGAASGTPAGHAQSSGSSSTASRPSRGSTAYDKLTRARHGGQGILGRWLVPVSAIVLVILIVGLVLLFSRGDELESLKSQVAALQAQNESTGGVDQLRAEFERLDARVEGLATELGNADEPGARMQALESQVAEQNAAVEALTGRVDELEQALASAQDAAPEEAAPADEAESASQSTQSSAQPADGDWVINLIAVGDRASAEQVQGRLAEMGVEAEIQTVTRDGRTLQRVIVPGYASRDDAQSAAPTLKKDLGLADDPWITRE